MNENVAGGPRISTFNRPKKSGKPSHYTGPIRNLDQGLDIPQKPRCLRKGNVYDYEPWKLQLLSTEYSKNLGYQQGEILKYRMFMQKHLGPGTHDINPKLFQKTPPSPCKDQNFGKDKRFPRNNIQSPGPANLNVKLPKWEIKHNGSTFSRAEKSSKIPMSLACNTYKIKDSRSLDAISNKVVSLRGPYDLFTGPRTPENIFNKQSLGKSCSPDTFYTWPSDIDNLLRGPSNKMKGKFYTAERFLKKPVTRHMLNDISLCYRNPNDPGPAEYHIRSTIRKLPEQLYPLGTSCKFVHPPTPWLIRPGVGRYKVEHPRNCLSSSKSNPSSVFKCKTSRAEYRAAQYNAF